MLNEIITKRVDALRNWMERHNALQAFIIPTADPHNSEYLAENRIVLRVKVIGSGKEKKNIQVADLLKKFETVDGAEALNDRMLFV